MGTTDCLTDSNAVKSLNLLNFPESDDILLKHEIGFNADSQLTTQTLVCQIHQIIMSKSDKGISNARNYRA